MFKCNKKLIIIWSILIFIHLIIALALPVSPNPGQLLIYVTIVILNKMRLPVFLNSHSGWGWSTPNWIGWLLGVFIWSCIYFGVAYLITKNITKNSR